MGPGGQPMIRIKRGFFVVGAPGGPPHSAELGFGTLGARLVPPMLFAGNSLRPGPPLAGPEARYDVAISCPNSVGTTGLRFSQDPDSYQGGTMFVPFPNGKVKSQLQNAPVRWSEGYFHRIDLDRTGLT